MSTSPDQTPLPSAPPRAGTIAQIAGLARDWWQLIVIAAAIGLFAGLITFAVNDREYEGEAILSVSPVAPNDSLYRGLSVLKESGEASRDVETLARLVQTAPVAAVAAELVGWDGDPAVLLTDIDATPIGGSSLVSVRARASSAPDAVELANAFGRATGTVLDARLASQASAITERLQAQIAAGGLSDASLQLIRTRIGELDAVRGAGDPTVALQTAAAPPLAPVGSGILVVGAAGLLLGLIGGLGAALLAHATTGRIRSADQVRDRLKVPVLAHVRNSGGADRRSANAFLALGTQLLRAAHDQRSRSVGLVGASDADCAGSLAARVTGALVDAGHDIILADLANDPTAAGTPSEAPSTPKSDAARRRGTNHRADLVIIDIPSLEDAPQAVRVARAADIVVVVARRGSTTIPELRDGLGLLEASGIVPLGVVLIDAVPSPTPHVQSARQDTSERPRPTKQNTTRRGRRGARARSRR